MDCTLQRSVICSVVPATQGGIMVSVPISSSLLKAEIKSTGLWGLKVLNCRRASAGYRQKSRKRELVYCSFSSSSDADGSVAGNNNENDAEYVNSSVVEAVGLRSGPDGFMIKMRDGRLLRCAHNMPVSAHLPDYSMHPAIILKMEDGSELLLPIIVSEMPSVLLMAALRDVPIKRPTVYQVLQEMNEKMGYRVKLVRVTNRVDGAYIAELHLAKLDDETECLSFDIRPSDAINIAVRCKVPIQVSKHLAYTDGMKVIRTPKVETSASRRLSPVELDRPTGHPCLETEEFDLITNMLLAADEERYKDAAMWRDKLTQLRSLRNWA